MRIQIGIGAANLTGSTVTGPTGGDTILGNGSLNYNSGGVVAGQGDLLDLSGSSGVATINAFSFRRDTGRSPDTILAANNANQSVFAATAIGRGTGNGSVVGGAHQWLHADTVAGSA